MNVVKEILDAFNKASKMKDDARVRATSVMKDQAAMDKLMEEYLEALCRFEEHADTCAFEVNEGHLCTEGEGLLLKARSLAYTVALVTVAYMDLCRQKRDKGLAVPRMVALPRHPRVNTAILALSVSPYMD